MEFSDEHFTTFTSTVFVLFHVETKAPHDVLTDRELTTVDQVVSTFSSTSTSGVLGLLRHTHHVHLFLLFFFKVKHAPLNTFLYLSILFVYGVGDQTQSQHSASGLHLQLLYLCLFKHL